MATAENVKATTSKPVGGYYVSKEDNTQVFFRVGVRKSKKDELVCTAVDSDNAEVLVLQLNNFYECTCGAAEDLAKDVEEGE